MYNLIKICLFLSLASTAYADERSESVILPKWVSTLAPVTPVDYSGGPERIKGSGTVVSGLSESAIFAGFDYLNNSACVVQIENTLSYHTQTMKFIIKNVNDVQLKTNYMKVDNKMQDAVILDGLKKSDEVVVALSRNNSAPAGSRKSRRIGYKSEGVDTMIKDVDFIAGESLTIANWDIGYLPNRFNKRKLEMKIELSPDNIPLSAILMDEERDLLSCQGIHIVNTKHPSAMLPGSPTISIGVSLGDLGLGK